MKKLKKLKTGLIQRNLAFAKLGLKLGKDLYTSTGTEVSSKLAETLTKRSLLLKNELGELKGSFLKAGQMLSLYAGDLLPKEFVTILAELQAQTAYLSWDVIKKQIDDETLLALKIEEDAFAAASIGQVHRAYSETGEKFALKIQYKNIEKLIKSDLWILRKLLKLTKLVPKNYDLEDVFVEVERMLKQEMDYERELIFTTRFYDLVKGQFIVPKIERKYSTNKVLCLEYITAKTVDESLNELNQKQKERLACDFFELFLKEIFEWQLLQSDAHAGNYLIKEGKWVLLDFGATKEISDEIAEVYKNILTGLFDQNRELIENTFRSFGAFDVDKSDMDYFWSYCQMISEPLIDPDYDWISSDISVRAMNQAKEIPSKMVLNFVPYENVFIDRKIIGVFYMLKKLGVKVDLKSIFEKYRNRL